MFGVFGECCFLIWCKVVILVMVYLVKVKVIGVYGDCCVGIWDLWVGDLVVGLG